MKHWHWPQTGTATAGEGGYAVPNGTLARCHACGRPIVFVEGYAFRRDYWRVSTERALIKATAGMEVRA